MNLHPSRGNSDRLLGAGVGGFRRVLAFDARVPKAGLQNGLSSQASGGFPRLPSERRRLVEGNDNRLRESDRTALRTGHARIALKVRYGEQLIDLGRLAHQ